MDVRCGSCNKLFRIADEKISGSGIKFACSQCHGPVTITREEFEQYAQAKTAEPVLPPAASQPRKMEVTCGSCGKHFRISEDKIAGSGIKFACSKCGNPVTVTREDFQQYFEPDKTEPMPPPIVPQPLKMEVRCGSCSKLFRISEDKITGSGIKFACSKCGAIVTISKEDLHEYKRNLDKTGQVSNSEMFQAPLTAPAPVAAPAAIPSGISPTVTEELQLPVATTSSDAKRSMPAPEASPAIRQPAPPAKNRETAMASPAAPRQAAPAVPVGKAAPKPRPPLRETTPLSPLSRDQARPAVKPRSEPGALVRPAPVSSASNTPPEPSTSRQLIVLAIVILIIVAVSYAAFSHFKASAPAPRAPARLLSSIDGLQVVNTVAGHDARGDYIISGDIVNSTDVEHPAWLLVAEVFDANGVLLGRARMLNGIELYTRRDYEILAKRGTNIQELKERNLQEQRSKILPRGTVHFDITILEPPAGDLKFNANLQPFDPVQLFKEETAEQKQP